MESELEIPGCLEGSLDDHSTNWVSTNCVAVPSSKWNATP